MGGLGTFIHNEHGVPKECECHKKKKKIYT